MILLLALKGSSGGHKDLGQKKATSVHPTHVAAAADSSVPVVGEIVLLRPTKAPAASVAPPSAEAEPVAAKDAGVVAPLVAAQKSARESRESTRTTEPGEGAGSTALERVAEGSSAGTPDGAGSEPAGDGESDLETDGRARGPRPRIAVLLKSSPPGALVGTAHHSFGATPVTVRLKIGGNYTFTFTSEGRRPRTKRIHVSGEPDQEFTVTLRRESADSAPVTTQGANQQPQPAKGRDPNWLQRMFSR